MTYDAPAIEAELLAKMATPPEVQHPPNPVSFAGWQHRRSKKKARRKMARQSRKQNRKDGK